MPVFFHKKAKQTEVIHHLRDIYLEVHAKHGIPLADFPDFRTMQQKLKTFDFRQLQSYNKTLFQQIERMFADFVPKLMSKLSAEQMSSLSEHQIKGGKFDEINGPFGYRRGQGADAGWQDSEWIVAKSRDECDKVFATLQPIDGKVTAPRAKEEMVKSKLPSSVLSRIYRLADVDGDGLLDADEFALAMHLVKVKLDGHDLPFVLPAHLVPPSKRRAAPNGTTAGQNRS